MSKKLNALREERNRIVTQARELLDKAETEKRDLSSEESGKYEELMTEQSKRADAISREERQIEAERTVAAGHFEKEERNEGKGGEGTTSAEYRSAFTKLMAFGRDGLNADEVRSLSAGSGTEGGYLVMPQEMVSGLIKAMDNEVFIRRKATVYSLPTAASLGAAALATDVDDANWTSELATGSEDSALAFGKRELTPKPLAKRIKISNKLLRAVPGVEGIVMSRLAYKFGVSQEKAFMTGTGANQPLGIFTASASGISTGRDVSTDNTSTAFTVDGLMNAKYSLKSQYHGKAEWIFHRDAVKMLAKLKNAVSGDYLWQPAITQGSPDLLLGRPVTMSEYAPNTFTSGLYVGIFGDFSNYWIADALNVQMQRLVELYAEANQTGFIGRLESDGMPVLEEAFARVKLG
jgi:HK97 family phage major capsid protein